MSRSGEAAGEEKSARPPGTRRGLARIWVAAAAAFAIGLFAGAIALGLLMDSPPSDLVTGDAATPTGTAEVDGGAEAEIEVNEACLRVINAAQDTVAAIEDLGESAADLDLNGLNEDVRRLQPLQGRLREDLAACRVDTTLPEDLSPAETPPGGAGEGTDGTTDPEATDPEEPASPTD